jgi:hypothetical protein
MIMKRILYIMPFILLAAASCKEDQLDVYNGADYVHFTPSINDIAEATYNFATDGVTTREETVEIPMHVSPRIDLIAPDPTGLPYDPVMGLYYDRAVIKWNGDSLNTNGVLVMVRWIGNNVDSDQVQDGAFVLNADIVPDNGECVLDNRLFQGIPDGAIITLSILRANIHDVNDFEFAEGLFTDVTFATVSQCLRAHIVLIREMP